MGQYAGALTLLGLAVAAVAGLYVLSLLLAVTRDPLTAQPFSGGYIAAEHALHRYHARWYAMSLVFLAFDLEMLFMYPWAVVVVEVGAAAVIEMFGFLLLLLAGIVYAWREGAFRWT